MSPQLVRSLIYAAAAMLVTIAVAFFINLAISNFRQMLADEREAGRLGCELRWQAEVAKWNAQAEAERLKALNETMAAQEKARDEIAAAERRAIELEKDNASLPNGDGCGLGIERVRLLNKR